MNKFLINILLAVGLVSVGMAQPTPVINPGNGTQQTYIDPNFHSVPYMVFTPNSGLTILVFDPTTSITDQNNAFGHYRKYPLIAGGGVPQLAVIPGVVRTNIGEQITRVQVPFSVTASTVLQTIPFNLGTTLQTNGHYKFVAYLYVISGTGGTKIDVGGTCNTSNFIASYQCFAATTLLYGGQLTSFLSGPSGSSTGTATLIMITGELDVTNGGTFVIQFAQNGSNATASTVLAGSTLTITQIP